MKHYIQPIFCLLIAAGLITFLVSLLGNSQTQLAEEKRVAENGWLYEGEGVVTQTEYNTILADLKDSQLAPSVSVASISGDLVTIKYYFWSVQDYPNLIQKEERPKILKFHSSVTPIVLMALVICGGFYYLHMARFGKGE